VATTRRRDGCCGSCVLLRRVCATCGVLTSTRRSATVLSQRGIRMGTDIHSIVQVQRRQDDWETIGSEVAGDQRVYDAFAILADVRNTEDKPYICKPRGLPKGLRLESWSRDTDGNLLGDHSHSWLTLDELVRFHARVLKAAIDYFGYTTSSASAANTSRWRSGSAAKQLDSGRVIACRLQLRTPKRR
jgi:hypothetical protein